MFGINEWQLALCASLSIAGLWIAAFILAEIWKYSWAWIDDSKPKKGNFMISVLIKTIESEWKYPVFLSSDEEPFGYAKNKKWNNEKVHDLGRRPESLKIRKDYVYKNDKRAKDSTRMSFFPIILIMSPFMILITVKFYVAAMVIGSLVLTAHLSRFTRRLSKKYKLHVDDKDIHLKPESEGDSED